MGHSVTSSNTILTLPSPAKLNLFLHITGRRADGYHELQTLFQFVDLCDTLTFELSDKPGIELLDPIPSVPLEKDLIYQAANLLQPRSPVGIRIGLTKKLPMGGGIGGGSSNAATTLLALNQLWNCGHSIDQLANIGLQLGADVPIFIFGHSAFAEGVGEKLTPASPNTPYYLLLKPDSHVATAQIFTDKNLTRDTPPITISHALKLGGHNDCLSTVRALHPEVNEAYLWLKNQGDAKLTGTGACLFAEFSHHADAERVRAQVPEKWQAWVCQGCNTSPTHQVLDQWIEHH